MRWARRLAALLTRRRRDRELDDEIAFHLAMQTEENVRRGLPEDEARRQAERAFGGVAATREDHRDARGVRWLEDLGRDARLAARSIRRAPLFALAVIALTALGIGANTAVYTVVDGVLLRPLPYPRPDELVELGRVGPDGGGVAHDGRTVAEVRRRAAPGEPVAAASWPAGRNLVAGETAVHVTEQPVSFEYFEVMGVPPRVGRPFSAGDEQPGAEPVVILGHELAERLGGAGALLGRQLLLGGRARTVVGVMPPGFRTRSRVDLLVPYVMGAEASGTNTLLLGRAGAGRAAADARMAATTAGLRAAGVLPERVALRWSSLEDDLSALRRPTLLLLLGAVALVLLVTCINLAGLMLVRAHARGAELALRAALGGGRARLVRQLLTEAMLYALAGGALGVALADAAVTVLLRHAPPDLSEWRVALDGRVLLFSLALTVATGVAFGLWPALRATRVDLRGALAGGASGIAGAGQRAPWRRGLLVVELALCTVLLVGAGLLGRTLLALRAVDPGFDARGVLALALAPDRADGSLYARILERVRAEPGVRAAAVAGSVPGRRGLNLPMIAPSGEVDAVSWRYVSAGTFELLAIPLRRGRTFGDRDGAAAQPVAVVNEAFVRRHHPGGDALGTVIHMRPVAGMADAPRLVVGVVGDTGDASAGREPEPVIYVPVAQVAPELLAISHRFFNACLLVRTDLPPAAARRLEEIVRAVEPGLPFAEVTRLEDVLDARVADERFLAWLVGLFALASLAIAAAGLYGVTAYGVRQRAREIGVRMALGAAPSRILREVLREGLATAAAGVALGLAAALPLAPVLRSFLFGVASFDPATVTAAVAVLAAAALLALALPALRASRMDPASTLRQG